jgi:hypothetical protein
LTHPQSAQANISDLLSNLEAWKATALATDYSEAEYTSLNPTSRRDHLLLKTDYWCAKILITQPCLRRLELRVENQSTTSADFDTKTAESCISAALEVAKLFPAQLNTDIMYKEGSWWEIVHISQFLPHLQL